jgi:flagellar biosynthesis GTPase FlhF
MTNWIIEFEYWDNYEADTKDEAIEQFRRQYGDSATITTVIKGAD